jgi:hypothetical protein
MTTKIATPRVFRQFPEMTFVWSKYGSETGTRVGDRPCQMAGCHGLSIGVRWPDGKLTWCCTDGMSQRRNGEWQIGYPSSSGFDSERAAGS